LLLLLNNPTLSASKIAANKIYGTLQCQNNGTPPGNGGNPNTVCGSEQGRCVGM